MKLLKNLSLKSKLILPIVVVSVGMFVLAQGYALFAAPFNASFQVNYHTALYNSLLFLVLLIVAVSVLYIMIDKIILEPLHRLSLGMQSFNNQKQYDLNVSSTSNDEIGALAGVVNEMRVRQMKREKQVIYKLDKLEEDKSFISEVVEAVNDALIVVDRSGTILHFNTATHDVFYCFSDGFEGVNLAEIIQCNEDNATFMRDALESGMTFTDKQVWIRNALGQQQLLKVSFTTLSRSERFLFTFQDVTDVEVALRRQRIAAGVFENSHDGLLVTDEDDVITMVNPSITRLLGYSQKALLGKKPEERLEWQHFRSLMPTIKESVMQYGQWQGEVWEKHLFGHKVPMFAKVSMIHRADDDKCDYVYILSDLSSVKEMERLEYLAHHDSLTGLANRAQLYSVLDRTLKDEREAKNGLALLYLDLDGFKLVNDTFGHDAGDEILKRVSERLLSQVRSQDLVARLAGDEFVILLKSTERESLPPLADRLIELIQQDIDYRGNHLKVGASIGVHYVDNRKVPMDDILKAADTAMYEAKNRGKCQFVLSEHES
ncbi:diguanylate cyclase domain-containing protein [Vibrio japonicus]|uniref:Diguanylate cyclase n=1 Tax=Vibrio japonicus TaxID=1824638 RepID=A0ABY5LKH0_9VIBR|nr:diguanylate cyclase [Vibrio japonicus]UUM32593.1 diguanylate cyclase [Vibrio japonicus]